MEPTAPEEPPPLPKASGKAIALNPTDDTGTPLEKRPVVPPKEPFPLCQKLMVDDNWPFVLCQGISFETPEYRHELLRNFGKFASELPKATTAEGNMSDFYEGAPNTTPWYLYGFLWGPLLEYIFSSQSFL